MRSRSVRSPKIGLASGVSARTSLDLLEPCAGVNGDMDGKGDFGKFRGRGKRAGSTGGNFVGVLVASGDLTGERRRWGERGGGWERVRGDETGDSGSEDVQEDDVKCPNWAVYRSRVASRMRSDEIVLAS
jgi:hypothetical protein